MMSDKLEEELRTIRKELHAHPEISGEEHETQKRIMAFLGEHTNADFEAIGGTGVLATFSGEKAGETVLIRGDIDALPIQEENEFEHRSNTDGVSHKCGHDGHTANLLGLAILLSQEPISQGKVYLLFQPAEETGQGAKTVLDDPVFPAEGIDYAFAMHNLPGFPLGAVVCREGVFTANVKSIIVKLKGKTAHAAEPEHGHNPAVAIAEIIQYADKHTKNEPNSDDFFLFTPVYASMGEKAYGVSAGAGEVHFTMRSWSTDLMAEMTAKFERQVAQTCDAYRLSHEISCTETFEANLNKAEAVAVVRRAGEKLGYEQIENESPFKWGEDFGVFTQRFPGAMFGVGSGEDCPALHNPDYDYPDSITLKTARMFHEIIKDILR